MRFFSLGICLLMLAGEVTAQVTHKTFIDAMKAGSKLLREKNLAGSVPHFEAALLLAATEKEQLEAYEALLPGYRELPTPEKMSGACEFIIMHGESTVRRERAARTFTGFLANRGLIEERLKSCEAQLQSAPEDLVALNVMYQIYSGPRRDAAQAAEFKTRLGKVNQGMASRKAEALEATAAQSPELAAWNWKEAGVAWMEAENFERAKAAAEKSLAAPPEQRSTVLTYYWRLSLGDIFAAAKDNPQAIAQYELSIAAAPAEELKKTPQEKLAKLQP